MDKFEIINLASQFRFDWNLSLTHPIDIISAALNNMEKISLVFMPMPRDVNGTSFKFEDEKIIFINDKDSEIRQRFTVAREIYNLEFEQNKSDAELFAQYLLLPNIVLKSEEIDLNKLVETELYYMIPYEEIIKRFDFKQKVNTKKIAKKLGLNTRLYEPYTCGATTMGHYITLSEKLFDEGWISKSEKEKFFELISVK